MTAILRISTIIISALVLYGLFPLIWQQYQGIKPCPALGPIPACYIVGICYLLIGFSAVPTRFAGYLFWLGWIPVFALALIGSMMEISGIPTCPRNGSNIPMCYFSLALSCLLLGFFLTTQRHEKVRVTKS